MSRITHYQVIYGMSGYSGLSGFSDEVQRNITQGWQPYGPMVIKKDTGSKYFYQPMVKYADTDGKTPDENC